jgi:hypothetical protein
LLYGKTKSGSIYADVTLLQILIYKIAIWIIRIQFYTKFKLFILVVKK